MKKIINTLKRTYNDAKDAMTDYVVDRGLWIMDDTSGKRMKIEYMITIWQNIWLVVYMIWAYRRGIKKGRKDK